MGVPETLSSPSGDCGTSGLALLRNWKIGAGFIIIPRLPRILTPQVLSLNSFFKFKTILKCVASLCYNHSLKPDPFISKWDGPSGSQMPPANLASRDLLLGLDSSSGARSLIHFKDTRQDRFCLLTIARQAFPGQSGWASETQALGGHRHN